jgi:hypothetical protein
MLSPATVLLALTSLASLASLTIASPAPSLLNPDPRVSPECASINSGEHLCCTWTINGDQPIVITLADAVGYHLNPNSFNGIVCEWRKTPHLGWINKHRFLWPLGGRSCSANWFHSMTARSRTLGRHMPWTGTLLPGQRPCKLIDEFPSDPTKRHMKTKHSGCTTLGPTRFALLPALHPTTTTTLLIGFLRKGSPIPYGLNSEGNLGCKGITRRSSRCWACSLSVVYGPASWFKATLSVLVILCTLLYDMMTSNGMLCLERRVFERRVRSDKPNRPTQTPKTPKNPPHSDHHVSI